MRRSAWPEPPAPRYTRLRGWFQSGESAWSLVAKFQLLNCLTLEQLLELVTPAEHRAREPLSFRFAQRFDLARLAALLGLVPEALGRSFLTANHRAPGAPLVARSVRFCARCLLAGWHLTMSQWRFLRRCPIHRSPLSRRCPRCTKRTSLDFRLDIALASQPYACSACGQVLAPQLEAPCGRPNALTAAQSLELERWMRTLEHYLAAFSPSAHTRHVRGDGQAKTADRSRARHARWSFLAEIAGVAHRAPPAWPRIGLPDIPASPLQPASLCAKPQHVPVTWRAEHWPHFDPGFATIATLYARERDRLAERTHSRRCRDLAAPRSARSAPRDYSAQSRSAPTLRRYTRLLAVAHGLGRHEQPSAPSCARASALRPDGVACLCANGHCACRTRRRFPPARTCAHPTRACVLRARAFLGAVDARGATTLHDPQAPRAAAVVVSLIRGVNILVIFTSRVP